MSHQGLSIRPRLLAASVASALGISGAFVAPAHAQDGQEVLLEEVVVTGSRIVRRDYQSNSPIVTVDKEAFEQQTGLNVEAYLNQLPQYNPAASPVTTQGDVQITPVNSVGIASISLRGFGPNRSLVLVDGRRQVPINALMVTDINSIPSALIERVETITGGASAVYGADAVGGVTNFILRDDFEGFDLDIQHGATQEGDGEESRIAIALGTNFANGRGNVTLGMESYNRNEALEINHDRYRERWRHPRVPGGLFLQGINGYSCNALVSLPGDPPFFEADSPHGCPSPAAIEGLFYDRPAGTEVFPTGSPFVRGFNFNSDGTIFVAGSEAGFSRYNGVINDEYVRTEVLDGDGNIYQGLKWNNQRAYISGPQERRSFFASGNFDLAEGVELFARGTFAESKTATLLFGTNAVGGWETYIPYDPVRDSPVDPFQDYNDPNIVAQIRDNPEAFPNPNFIPTGTPGAHFPVPHELAILLNSRTNFAGESAANGPWQPDWNPDDSLPPRSTYNTNTVWQIEFGIGFDIGSSWSGEVYYSHGESSTYNLAGGNLSLERYRALLNSSTIIDGVRTWDYGRGAEISGNAASNRPFFGAADVTCTSGFYDTFFRGDAPLSQDCFDAVNATLQTRTQNQQDIIELNFQGKLVELPAGEARAAAGYQSRRNASQFYPDILQSTVSFTDQVVGVYPTGYLDASTSVDDYYFEALLPVISGKRGVDLLELELGVRYSDYEHTDEETTWKGMLNWQINNWARLRGGFNRATRAPNLGELFLNPQEIFTIGGQNFGDACGLRSNSPFGARGTGEDPQLNTGEIDPMVLGPAPGQTLEGAMSTRLICEAMMGGAGSNAVTQFYTVSDATGQAGGGFNWVLQQGNSNLVSETADTWTFGFVANSPFDSPWLSGATLALDWYKVEIENAIMLYSLDYAAYRCFGTVLVTTEAEAQAQAETEACRLLPRDQNNGAPLTTTLSYDNQARIETAGLDIALNWRWALADFGMALPGTIGFNLQATYLDHYRTKQSPAVYDVETEWKGSLGPNLSGTQAGAYEYRLFGGLSYSQNNWSVSLRWRHLPGVWSAGYASQQAIIENNLRVEAGGEGIILGYTPSTEIKTDSYNLFDLAFNWNINEMLSLRGGITNLFDTDPKLTSRTAGWAPGTDLSSACEGRDSGCTNPSSYSLPGVGNFTPGYYDTLGRRFFLGMNVRF